VISNGVVQGRRDSADVGPGLRIRGRESSGASETSQWNIHVHDIVIREAARRDQPDPAFEIFVGLDAVFSRLRIHDLTLDTCGYRGIEKSGPGEIVDLELERFTVRNPGSHSGATGSQTHALRVHSGVLRRGGIRNGSVIDDRGDAATMQLGYSSQGQLLELEIAQLRSAGHTHAIGFPVQVRSDSAVLPLDAERVLLQTQGASTWTLADGFEGQRLELVMTAHQGDGPLVPEHMHGTSVVFRSVGDTALLCFTAGGWARIGGTAA